MDSKKQDNKTFLQAMQTEQVRPLKQPQANLSQAATQESLTLQRLPKVRLLQTVTAIRLHNPHRQVAYASGWRSQTQALAFGEDRLSRQAWKDLKQGKYPIDDEMDLHGHTIKKARQFLESYFSELQQLSHRSHSREVVVRIIHGKGLNSSQQLAGTLKYHVNYWLPQLAQVRAFCSCVPVDGGTGAVYVLLGK